MILVEYFDDLEL